MTAHPPPPPSQSLWSRAVTTRGPKDEPYPDFQKRVAEDSARVRAKCAALDQFTPRCTACGETCNPIEAGQCCKVNNIPMRSRWASEMAEIEWYRLGHFAPGGWVNSVEALAVLLDRVRAEAKEQP
jgi:hypothetical protein